MRYLARSNLRDEEIANVSKIEVSSYTFYVISRITWKIVPSDIKILHKCVKISSPFYVSKSGYNGRKREQKYMIFQ